MAEFAHIAVDSSATCPPDMQYHPGLVGMRRAMELMLTGDVMSGREAAEWGFATRAFPAGELERRTLERRDTAFGDYRTRPS